VKFWDSSAIVPLVVEEPSSRYCRQLLRSDQTLVVWCLTRTEVLSALWRQHRGGLLTGDEVAHADARLTRMAERWVELVAIDVVRDEAERLLRRHRLRAADALQLAAARVWAQGSPRGRMFVGLDDALLAAAGKEGFTVRHPGARISVVADGLDKFRVSPNARSPRSRCR
jgi:predicted nucleic acid-binding protein